MKKILITGGCGFIGFNTAIKINSKKYKVIVIDNLSRKGVKKNYNILVKKKIPVHLIDCKNKTKIKNTIKSIKPNYIFHFAGQVTVTNSILNPVDDLNENILSTVNILESIKYLNIKPTFIYSSTNKVYGDLKSLKILTTKNKYEPKNKKFYGINENTKLDLRSPYGCSKGSAESYIIDYSKTYGFKYFIIRQSCIYGPFQYGQESQGWVSWIILRSFFKKKINIFGNGKQVRDILYIDDLTDFYFKLLDKSKKINSNIFNIGGAKINSISILELISILENRLKIKINYSYKKERDGDQKLYISDISRAKKLINWSPNIEKTTGINRLISWVIKEKKYFRSFFK